MIELWRRIPSFPGYSASSLGRIAVRGEKILRACISTSGYERYTIKRNGKSVSVTGHILVCEAFHGPKPTSKHEVRHLDGSKINNIPMNLKWGTRKENVADKFNHGTDTRGQRNPLSKLTDEQVISIRREYKEGISATKLAKKYGIGRSNAFEIVAGRRWAHLLADETAK